MLPTAYLSETCDFILSLFKDLLDLCNYLKFVIIGRDDDSVFRVVLAVFLCLQALAEMYTLSFVYCFISAALSLFALSS